MHDDADGRSWINYDVTIIATNGKQLTFTHITFASLDSIAIDFLIRFTHTYINILREVTFEKILYYIHTQAH